MWFCPKNNDICYQSKLKYSLVSSLNIDGVMSETEQTETTKPDPDGGIFLCCRCSMTERYSYYGRSPRFLRDIVFLEDCYVMQNPFSAAGGGADRFVVLGSHCTACGECVCQGTQCSVFYAKRFCMDCARANSNEMPPEMRAKIK
ncbi:Cysteine-rich domain DPF-motif [Trinorchestia longiramus]|nr:Cysteine-rich domain DPF-motif [Trinorchestia longiramus]